MLALRKSLGSIYILSTYIPKSIMCRNEQHSDILHFQESPADPSNHMVVDNDDLENQDPSEVIKTTELGVGVDSFSQFVAPEDMLVVAKDEAVFGEEVIGSPTCSYEEIVHHDDEIPTPLGVGDLQGETRILFILTQWTLTLQEVYQERVETDNGFKNLAGTKCICSKTSLLTKELEGMTSRLTELRHYNTSLPVQYLSEEKELHRIQMLIKAHVSIQISRPSEETVFEARRLVTDIEDPGQYLSALTRNLIGIIKDLLPCGSGRHFECTEGEYFPQEGTPGVMEQDEEEDMSLLVASMSTSPSKSRKRKQVNKQQTHHPPTTLSSSSPSKKPRKGRSFSLDNSPNNEKSSPPSFRVRPNVIDILEKNKKMAKTNGLYQFVLWREALKAEKDRVVHPSPSNGKSHLKRLSFDL